MDVRGVGTEDVETAPAGPPAPPKPKRRALILGWIALGISIVVSGCWAFWGTLEAFHEGWWAATLSGRLVQVAAYHAPLGIMLTLSALAIRWPKLGACMYFVLGALFSFFIFRERWGHLTWDVVLSWVPVTVVFAGVGLLWWFGKPRPMRLAYLLAMGLPLLTSAICAIEPVWRVSHRDMTPQLSELTLPGNGVELTWAPPGPGWVRGAKHSCNWHEATDICARLSADGTQLMDTPQGCWRLPTAAELVASVTRNGVNCGGVWDAAKKQASYKVWPDKEPPLWDPVAETIYWWTSTEDGPDKAYFMTFEGRLYSSMKDYGLGSKGFRAVRTAAR